MAQRFGGKIVTDGLVLCLDAHDAKSYAGEPANNLNSDTNDYTGTSYSYNGEWTSSPTRLSKSYDSTIKTPIGTGATLIQESGTNGYHHLSRMGGGETGNHTISFYFKPVTSDINNLKIGMLGDSNPIITFDFTQSPATVTQTGSAISGKLALLAPLSNGWYFCAADFNGRSGGWVGAVGFNINAAYTGVLGSKKAYICGLNYNNKAYAVPSFDRSATDGWVDRSGNSNDGTLVNGTNTGVSHYRDGQVIMPVTNSYLDFDGSDDKVDCGSVTPDTGDFTVEFIYQLTGNGGRGGLFERKASSPYNGFSIGQGGSGNWGFAVSGTSNYSAGRNLTWTYPTLNTWYHDVGVYSGGNSVTIYRNGSFVDSTSGTAQGNLSTQGTRTNFLIANRDNLTSLPCKVGLVRVYNKALTAAEVLRNYNATKNRFT